VRRRVTLAIEQMFGYGNAMGVESLFEVTGSYCLDCQTTVAFLGIPSDASCPNCGLRMCLTHDGMGRYPSAESFVRGIQGRKPGVGDR
jgi:hypothetical protein